MAKETDDISRFRDEKKLCAYVGSVLPTYASGGKICNGRITKTGNTSQPCGHLLQQANQSSVVMPPPYACYQRLRISEDAKRKEIEG